MPRSRTTYTAEFKLAAVKMIAEQKLSVAEAARRLDISENLLRNWQKVFLAKGNDAFPGQGKLTPADEDRSPRTSWIETLHPKLRTKNGVPILPTSRRRKVDSTWPSSRICSAA